MGPSERRRIAQVRGGHVREIPDQVAVEEPLGILVDGRPASTTMRTPGHDTELALGWCVSEGIASSADDIVHARECFETLDDEQVRRSVHITTRHQPTVHPRLHATSSACGICGGDVVSMTTSGTHADTRADTTTFAADVLYAMPDAMRVAQRHFDANGGTHAAALFDPSGDLVCLREDVGRHNAVDKVVGWAVSHGRLPLHGMGLQVSGRASAELIHKAATAGIPLLAAVSAPTSLAIDLARATGMTLIGFVRGDTMNVYSGVERIIGLARDT